MRIISGCFKGYRLPSPRGRHIRPTTERVREAVFSSLGCAVEAAAVLELFAGTGVFGFEALSRGAGRVVFVDRDRRATELVKRTVAMLGVQDRVVVLTMTWLEAVQHLAARGERFEVTFLDPPYEGEWVEQVFSHRDFQGLIALDSVVIVEREAPGPDVRVPVGFERRFCKRYGGTLVEIFHRGPGEI